MHPPTPQSTTRSGGGTENETSRDTDTPKRRQEGGDTQRRGGDGQGHAVPIAPHHPKSHPYTSHPGCVNPFSASVGAGWGAPLGSVLGLLGGGFGAGGVPEPRCHRAGHSL